MRRLLASCLLIVAVCAGTSLAREYQVRLLQGDENNGTWGTSEFEVQVNYMGSVRSVKVKGVEVLRQSAALYTSPIDPGTKSGARTVQGEGFGARGLSVERPTMKTWDDDGTRFFEFHIVGNP